jgi:hypothetical protein
VATSLVRPIAVNVNTGAVTYEGGITGSEITDASVGIADLSATGTPSSSTYLRGDNTWATVAGGSGGPGAPTAKTGNYTAASGDLVLADTSGGAFAVTSPAATSGAWFAVKKKTADTNVLTVTPASGTIDGASSFTTSAGYSAYTFVADGTNWWVV